MPINNTDIKSYKSTAGGGNLGGAIDAASEITSGVVGNVFDKFTGTETSQDGVYYHCTYFKNTHPTLTAEDFKVFIGAETSHAGVNVEIGIGSSGVNGSEQSIINENTPPSSVTFDDADGEVNALIVGDIPSGQHIAIWQKVTIIAANFVAPNNNYNVPIEWVCDTAA